ncbi:MAG: SRPBCC family protein [Bacteroidota bacterium]
MEIKRNFTINQPADRVWEVLGNQFGQACEWVTGLYHSEASGNPASGNAQSVKRTCDTNQGKIKEEIRAFDPKNYHLSYAVIEGFPSFVKSGVNTWRLMPKGNKTEVDVHFVAELQGVLGFLMKPIMRMQLGKVFDQAVNDLKVFVETGKPSQAKSKELAKRAARA